MQYPLTCGGDLELAVGPLQKRAVYVAHVKLSDVRAANAVPATGEPTSQRFTEETIDLLTRRQNPPVMPDTLKDFQAAPECFVRGGGFSHRGHPCSEHW